LFAASGAESGSRKVSSDGCFQEKGKEAAAWSAAASFFAQLVL